MTSVSTRSSGAAYLAAVVSTDCCSSEVAKGPQVSLQSCRNSKGKIKGKIHTLSGQTSGEGREACL